MGGFISSNVPGDHRTYVDGKIKDCLNKIDQLWENQKRIDEMNKGQLKLITEICKKKDELIELKLESEGPDLRRLREENDQLSQYIEDLKKECFDLQNRNQNLEQERNRRHIPQLRAQPVSVPVVMYSASMNSTLADLVSTELENILSAQIQATKEKTVCVERVTDPHCLPQDKPIIVICINASRIGTDVQQALQNVTYNKNVIVAIVHHKEIHALPAQSSDKLLISDDYKKLRAIIDIAYIRNKGMYACDMNNKSLDKLIEIICPK